MISLVDPTAGTSKALVYQLKVVLLGSKPLIWRRLQVPGDANLGWLHAVLQIAVGWTNSHLHQFRFGKSVYSDTRHCFAEFEDDPEILEERNSILQKLVQRKDFSFGYEYDFGDSWEHEVTVETIQPSDRAAATFAFCLDGARACPPEDCGGMLGYDNLVKILKNRKHPEHKHMIEWLGGPFDTEAFDLTGTNLWLRKLKWPRVTEAQLRKVVMGRDDYHE